jgi:PhzF family phenazine biosynthesis protein
MLDVLRGIMKTYTVFQVDSFTKTMFSGNPAGVVLNADGLSEMDMQNIARELNNSETAFFFSSTEPNCDGELRYFTPKTEVPTCGHATIAALYAKAVEEKLESCTLKIKTKVGILPMEIAKQADDYYISMTQGKFEISEPLEDMAIRDLLVAVKLSEADLDKRCPIQIASTGHSKVLIGIKSRTTLNELIPDNEKLIALSQKIKCNGYFVFTFDTDKKDVLTEGRMFAPAIGITEDPVTGNANGPLGAYLIHNKLVHANDGVFRFVGFQGETAKRPGRIAVEVTVTNGKPERVKISGEARIVFKTEITI